MRKGLLIVLVVALLLGMAAPAVADSGIRPFKGSVHGSIMRYTGGVEGDPGGPLNLPSTAFEVTGTIIATHLGKGTMKERGWSDYPSGVLCPPGSSVYCGSFYGCTFEFVAANGDMLYGDLEEGSVTTDLETGYAEGRFLAKVTGGTGRFQGATGMIVKEWIGWLDPSGAGVIDSSWVGMIGY